MIPYKTQMEIIERYQIYSPRFHWTCASKLLSVVGKRLARREEENDLV
jgi:hypothetical protein